MKDLKRIRFMTSHPKDLSDELIRDNGREQKSLPSSSPAHAVRKQPYLKDHEPPL